MKKKWKVIFDKDGDHIKKLYKWDDIDDYSFVEPYEFCDILTYKAVIYNNSTVNIIFTNSKGFSFVSTLQVLLEAIDKKMIINGNQINGQWFFRKRGDMVLLYLKTN